MNSGVQVQQGQQGQPGSIQMIDTIRRDEVNTVIANQNAMLNAAKELRSFLADVHSKTDNILNNQARAPTAQVSSLSFFLERYTFVYF